MEIEKEKTELEEYEHGEDRSNPWKRAEINGDCISCWTLLRTLEACAIKDSGLNSLIALHTNFNFSAITISPLLDFPLLTLFLLCLSMAIPSSTSCPMKLLYYSPIAAITNYYEHSNTK